MTVLVDAGSNGCMVSCVAMFAQSKGVPCRRYHRVRVWDGWEYYSVYLFMFGLVVPFRVRIRR